MAMTSVAMPVYVPTSKTVRTLACLGNGRQRHQLGKRRDPVMRFPKVAHRNLNRDGACVWEQRLDRPFGQSKDGASAWRGGLRTPPVPQHSIVEFQACGGDPCPCPSLPLTHCRHREAPWSWLAAANRQERADSPPDSSYRCLAIRTSGPARGTVFSPPSTARSGCTPMPMSMMPTVTPRPAVSRAEPEKWRNPSPAPRTLGNPAHSVSHFANQTYAELVTGRDSGFAAEPVVALPCLASRSSPGSRRSR